MAGDIVEVGIALGGSAIVLAAGAQARNRRFYGFDVFEIIPAPSENNDGEDAHQRYRTVASGKSLGIAGDTYYGYQPDLYDTIVTGFRRHGYEVDGVRIALVKGLVQETFLTAAPDLIALAHIDCDWHDPVEFCLHALRTRLAPGGLIIVDDYHDYKGARAAVDSFLADNGDFTFEEGANPILVRSKADG